jgi:predicted DsbA family dithiol-disulfide isomerase
MWLDDVEKAGRIKARWHFFSLSENARYREGQRGASVWETNPKAKGIAAFKSAIAARRQGEELYNRYRLALQKARHEGGMPVDEGHTHLEAARKSGLDVARFEADLGEVDLQPLAREHAEAVKLGIFGVPTLSWPEGRSYYVKITDLVPKDRAVALYDAIETVHRFGEVVEIKTPESEGTIAA